MLFLNVPEFVRNRPMTSAHPSVVKEIAGLQISLVGLPLSRYRWHPAPPVKSIPAAIGRIPENFMHLDPSIFLIGGISLVLLLLLSNRKERWATFIPPPLLVVG
jgi:hypothetical protein